MDKHASNIYEKARHVLQNQEEFLAYIRAEQAEQDYKAQMKYATEKGEKKGEEIGVKKGKIEEKIEVATKLKELDFPVEQIAEITGMSVEKIRELYTMRK